MVEGLQSGQAVAICSIGETNIHTTSGRAGAKLPQVGLLLISSANFKPSFVQASLASEKVVIAQLVLVT
jgi:hypothetical protein